MQATKPHRPIDNGLTRYLRNEISATELVNKHTISNITILLTYTCPAACDHCIFTSSPSRKETVDPEAARRLIEAGSRQQPPPLLSFSGGEPFLQLPLMRELVTYGSDRGMPSEVISSSAWCKSDEFTRDVLADLKQRGLRTYCTSVDRYHTPFVDTRKMRRAVMTAREVGMKVVLNTMVDPDSLGKEEEYLSHVLDLPASIVKECYVNRLITTPVGRARTNVNDFLYQDKNFAEGCPYSTEIVTLSPHGFLYPCCGMVLGENPKDAALFVHDDVSQKSVDEIEQLLDDLKHDLFFKLLQLIGPYRILAEVKRRRPELQTRDSFTGSCDVCLEFTSNREVANAARELLAEYSEIIRDECEAAM